MKASFAKLSFPILGLMTIPLLPAAESSTTISLAGEWQVRLDRENRGVSDKWFGELRGDSIPLPGSLPGSGIGDPVTVDTPWIGSLFDKSYFTKERYAPYRKPGNIKVPFWLQPETYYRGIAWYQREIEIPAEWAAKRVLLTLERPHWATEVWLDGPTHRSARKPFHAACARARRRVETWPSSALRAGRQRPRRRYRRKLS